MKARATIENVSPNEKDKSADPFFVTMNVDFPTKRGSLKTMLVVMLLQTKNILYKFYK
jgi:hypothetical protein